MSSKQRQRQADEFRMDMDFAKMMIRNMAPAMNQEDFQKLRFVSPVWNRAFDVVARELRADATGQSHRPERSYRRNHH